MQSPGRNTIPVNFEEPDCHAGAAASALELVQADVASPAVQVLVARGERRSAAGAEGDASRQDRAGVAARRTATGKPMKLLYLSSRSSPGWLPAFPFTRLNGNVCTGGINAPRT